LGHITGVGEMRNAYKILLGKEICNFGYLGVDGSILKKLGLPDVRSDHLNCIKPAGMRTQLGRM